jgi:hypothetical protein
MEDLWTVGATILRINFILRHIYKQNFPFFPAVAFKVCKKCSYEPPKKLSQNCNMGIKKGNLRLIEKVAKSYVKKLLTQK